MNLFMRKKQAEILWLLCLMWAKRMSNPMKIFLMRSLKYFTREFLHKIRYVMVHFPIKSNFVFHQLFYVKLFSNSEASV